MVRPHPRGHGRRAHVDAGPEEGADVADVVVGVGRGRPEVHQGVGREGDQGVDVVGGGDADRLDPADLARRPRPTLSGLPTPTPTSSKAGWRTISGITIRPTKPVPQTTTRFGGALIGTSRPELTMQVLAGDRLGVVGGEEGGHVGHLAVLGHPAQRELARRSPRAPPRWCVPWLLARPGHVHLDVRSPHPRRDHHVAADVVRARARRPGSTWPTAARSWTRRTRSGACAGLNIDWEPMRTTDPPPPAFIAAATGRITLRAPSTLVSKALRQSSNLRS